MLGLSVVGLIIYLIVSAITHRVHKDAKRAVIKRAIVQENPNCSLCSGNCEMFIDGVINKTKRLDECPHISKKEKAEIEELLELEPEINGDKVACVMCKGGARAVNQYGYAGPTTCEYSNQLFDGLKVCEYGCQGCMDCATVCPTGAIKKNKAGVAEIDRSLCIGCGACELKCPDGLIKMVDIHQEIAIACKQSENSRIKEDVKKFCGVGCTKCGECVRICPTNAITQENGKIQFNLEKCIKCHKCVNVCPNATISNISQDFLNF